MQNTTPVALVIAKSSTEFARQRNDTLCSALTKCGYRVIVTSSSSANALGTVVRGMKASGLIDDDSFVVCIQCGVLHTGNCVVPVNGAHALPRELMTQNVCAAETGESAHLRVWGATCRILLSWISTGADTSKVYVTRTMGWFVDEEQMRNIHTLVGINERTRCDAHEPEPDGSVIVVKSRTGDTAIPFAIGATSVESDLLWNLFYEDDQKSITNDLCADLVVDHDHDSMARRKDDAHVDSEGEYKDQVGSHQDDDDRDDDQDDGQEDGQGDGHDAEYDDGQAEHCEKERHESELQSDGKRGNCKASKVEVKATCRSQDTVDETTRNRHAQASARVQINDHVTYFDFDVPAPESQRAHNTRPPRHKKSSARKRREQGLGDLDMRSVNVAQEHDGADAEQEEQDGSRTSASIKTEHQRRRYPTLPTNPDALLAMTRQAMILEPGSELCVRCEQALAKVNSQGLERLRILISAWRSKSKSYAKEIRQMLVQAATERTLPAVHAQIQASDAYIRKLKSRKRRINVRESETARLRAHEYAHDVGMRGRWSETRSHPQQSFKR